MFVRFSVLGGPQDGLEIEVNDLPLTLGREGHAAFPTTDRWASRHHCQLAAEDGQLALRDLGSKHGTFVNGDRVTQSVVGAGDRIMVGLTVLVVRALELAELPPQHTSSDRPSGISEKSWAR